MHLANFLGALIGAYSGFEPAVCNLRRPALKIPAFPRAALPAPIRVTQITFAQSNRPYR